MGPRLETLNNARGFVSWPRNCAAASSFDTNFTRLREMCAQLRGHSKIRRYALKGEVNPEKAYKTYKGRGCSSKSQNPALCRQKEFVFSLGLFK